MARVALALGLALLWGAPAGAQVTPLSIEQLDPAPAPGSNLLGLTRSRVLPHLAPSAALFAHYADDTLQLGRRSDDRVVLQRVVDARVTAEALLALGLLDLLEIGVAVPLIVWQDAHAPSLKGPAGPALAATALGDVRVSAKVVLWRSEEASGVGVAVAATLFVPTGDGESFASDDALRVEPRLVVDWRSAGGLAFVANVAWQARPARRFLNHLSDDLLRWGAGVQIPLWGPETLALVGTISGAIVVGSDLEDDDARGAPAEVLGGLSWRPGGSDDGIVIGGGVGAGISEGVGAPDVRAFFMVGWTPLARSVPVDVEGPGPVDDTDGDGVVDGEDVCPEEPEDVDGFEDADGCPDPDNDGDGVPDAGDRCPEEAEDADLFEDADGCPDPDNDGDGVSDAADGPRDASGLGACRDQRETPNGFEDEDGCPDNAPEPPGECTMIALGDHVRFSPGSAAVGDDSGQLLAAVVSVLASLGEDWVVLYLDGHADARERAPDGLAALSLSRAQAVRRALIEAGVPAEKVRAVGHGHARPLARGDGQTDRELNRRVELRIIEGGCTL